MLVPPQVICDINGTSVTTKMEARRLVRQLRELSQIIVRMPLDQWRATHSVVGNASEASNQRD